MGVEIHCIINFVFKALKDYIPYDENAEEDALRTVHEDGYRLLLRVVRHHRTIVQHGRQHVYLIDAIMSRLEGFTTGTADIASQEMEDYCHSS